MQLATPMPSAGPASLLDICFDDSVEHTVPVYKRTNCLSHGKRPICPTDQVRASDTVWYNSNSTGYTRTSRFLGAVLRICLKSFKLGVRGLYPRDLLARDLAALSQDRAPETRSVRPYERACRSRLRDPTCRRGRGISPPTLWDEEQTRSYQRC